MLFALDYFEQNINSHIFYDWCKFTLIPSLKTKCVIVMDNARFHKSKRIQKLLNRHGHRILWLPPYSPDLNPIEKNGLKLSFYAKGGWRIICLNYFMIWAVPVLLWIDYSVPLKKPSLIKVTFL